MFGMSTSESIVIIIVMIFCFVGSMIEYKEGLKKVKK